MFSSYWIKFIVENAEVKLYMVGLLINIYVVFGVNDEEET